MSLQLACFFSAVALLVVAAIGGGITIREIAFPRIGLWARISIGVVGLLLLGGSALWDKIIPPPSTDTGAVTFIDDPDAHQRSATADIMLNGEHHRLTTEGQQASSVAVPIDRAGEQVNFILNTTTVYADGHTVARSGHGSAFMRPGETYHLSYVNVSLFLVPES